MHSHGPGRIGLSRKRERRSKPPGSMVEPAADFVYFGSSFSAAELMQ